MDNKTDCTHITPESKTMQHLLKIRTAQKWQCCHMWIIALFKMKALHVMSIQQAETLHVHQLNYGLTFLLLLLLPGGHTEILEHLILYLCGVGARLNPYTEIISDVLCIPIWVLIIPDSSTRALWQLPEEISSSKAWETWREMAGFEPADLGSNGKHAYH
jgi:hypothetical protein